MSLIREKATESEAVVQNITKDIQVLDLAKKNLILSMTTLKRLQMLGMYALFLHLKHISSYPDSALTQLQSYVKERNYTEVTQSLGVRTISCICNHILCGNQAVKQLSASFKTFTAVPRVSQVLKRIQHIQGELRTMIDADFDALCVPLCSSIWCRSLILE
jgi:hypothetical protein